MLAQKKPNRAWQGLALIVALGFLLRLFLAAITDGYYYDYNCFTAWGLRMAEVGAADFYAADYFCDYPPAYLYVLGMVGQLMNLLELNYLDTLSKILMVVFPALCDAGLALFAYHMAQRYGNQKIALRLAAFVAFCPMFWYDTAVWKQVDGVLALMVVGCFYLLHQKRFVPAAFLYGLSLAVKPQALILGPVLAVCFLLPVFFAADIKAFWRSILDGALGVLAAIVPIYLCGLPFFGFGNTLKSLYNLYLSTGTSYPYATVNGFNFMAACGANWVAQDQQMSLTLFGTSYVLPVTWQAFGTAAIALITVYMVVLALRSYRQGGGAGGASALYAPMFLAGVYMVALFTFSHRMHERYLLLGIALLVGAVAQFGSMRLLGLAGGLSLTTLLNMAVVYTVVETDDQFLTSATSILTVRVVSLAETLLCVLLLYEAWQICSGKRGASCVEIVQGEQLAEQNAAQPKFAAKLQNAAKSQQAEKTQQPEKAVQTEDKQPITAPQNQPYQPKPQAPWQWGEVLFIVILTLAVAVLSFVYLGDMTAPQNALDLRGDMTSETVVPQGDATELWVYTGVVVSGSSFTLTDADGEIVLFESIAIGSLFQWQIYEITPSDAYTIIIADAEVMEIAFKDANGDLLPLTLADGTVTSAAANSTGVCAMFDEQALVPETASQLNSFYFDEIYHARTAYESVNSYDIYEISHPPMGKNFIAIGIMLFGMTGFGWRFAGVLFGVLMVPVIYWLTRRLTRSPLAAGFVALLLSFDFMRYAQSRIATIDTISAFFILLAATCMVWYCQSVLEKGVRSSVLPMALAGLAFGFGAASKWTGLYAGVGLAILYFGVLALRLYQEYTAAGQPMVAQGQPATQPTAARKNGAQKNKAKSAQAQAAAQANAKPRAGKHLAKQPEQQRGAYLACRKEFAIAIGGGVLFFVLIPAAIYLASYLPYRLADPNFGLAEWWANQEYMLWYHGNLDATHPFSSSWYTWFLDLRPVWYYMGDGLAEGTYASIAGFYNPILCWVGILAWLRLCLRALQGKGSFIGNALIVLFLSQFLPWLLITRCTFLYHYFPSFLFTVVAIGLWFCDIRAKHETRAFALAAVLLTLVAVFFVCFYPVLSGLPVGALWAQTLKMLPSYGFYIIS